MSGLLWLIGLLLLVAVLFLVASMKSPVKISAGSQVRLFDRSKRSAKQSPSQPTKHSATKHSDIAQDVSPVTRKLHRLMAPGLPGCLLSMKANRVLITKQGRQCAIVTIDPKAVLAERRLDDVLILNITPDYTDADIDILIDKIIAHISVIGSAD